MTRSFLMFRAGVRFVLEIEDLRIERGKFTLGVGQCNRVSLFRENLGGMSKEEAEALGITKRDIEAWGWADNHS